MLSTQAKLSLALVGITVTWRVCGYCLRRFFVRKFTVTEDLKHLGKARQDEQRIRGNAVVCGGRYVPMHHSDLGAPLYTSVHYRPG
jgi:hypothetical protein